MNGFIKLTALKEEAFGKYPNQFDMAKNISKGYEFLAAKINDARLKAQKEFGDEITAAILFAEKYEKHAWMLNSIEEN